MPPGGGQRIFTALEGEAEGRRDRPPFDPTWLGSAGSIETALRAFGESQSTGEYVDRHAWQFTPASFRQIVGLPSDLSMIQLRPLRVYPTLAGTQEFWAILEATV